MNILFLCAQIRGWGGSYARSLQLGKALVSLGHRVTIVLARQSVGSRILRSSISGISIFEVAGYLPKRLRHGGLDPFDLISRLIAVRGSFDIAHLYSHRPSVVLHALFLRKRGVPIVLDWVDLVGLQGFAGERRRISAHTLGAFDDWSERSLPKMVDGVTVISEYLSRSVGELGIHPDRTTIIPPGADVQDIRRLNLTEFRRDLSIPIDAKVVGHAGFTHWDTQLIGETFVELARKDSRAMLMHIGPDFPHVRHTLKQAGLGNKLIATGPILDERYEQYLACADVFLLPYTDRPFNQARYPNKFGDFMAAGRPTVTNPTGDLAKLIDAENIGTLTASTPAAMAKAIKVYFDNPDLANETGLRARAAAERFTWLQQGRRLEDFFQQTIERTKSLSGRNSLIAQPAGREVAHPDLAGQM